MKIVIRVELITDWGDAKTIEVGRIDRPSQMLDAESVGLSMAEGKQLLHNLRQAVIPPDRRHLHRAAHLSTMPSLDGVEELPATQSGYRSKYQGGSQAHDTMSGLRLLRFVNSATGYANSANTA